MEPDTPNEMREDVPPEAEEMLAAMYRPTTAEELLPWGVEWRKLAARRTAQQKPGQTLRVTALVHQAHLRLVDGEKGRSFSLQAIIDKTASCSSERTK